MKKIWSFLRAIVMAIIVKPFKWLWTKAKALFVKKEPVLKRAAANLPGEVRSFRDNLKALWAAFKTGWKAVRGWTWLTRLAFVIALFALLTGDFIVAHQIGHRKVPALQRQVLDLGTTIVGKDTVIVGLESDLAKLQAELDKARTVPAKAETAAKPHKATNTGKRTPRTKPKTTSVVSEFANFFN